MFKNIEYHNTFSKNNQQHGQFAEYKEQNINLLNVIHYVKVSNNYTKFYKYPS